MGNEELARKIEDSVGAFARFVDETMTLLGKARMSYVEFATVFAEAARQIGEEGQRSLDGAANGGLGTGGEEPVNPQAADSGYREEPSRAAEGTLEFTVAEHPIPTVSQSLKSRSINIRRGTISVRTEMAKLLRELAEEIENQHRELPCIIVTGIPFNPTADGMHLEMYTYVRSDDYEKQREYLWRRFNDHD